MCAGRTKGESDRFSVARLKKADPLPYDAAAMEAMAFGDAFDCAVRSAWHRRTQRELLLDLGERKNWVDAEYDQAVRKAADWLVEALLLQREVASEEVHQARGALPTVDDEADVDALPSIRNLFDDGPWVRLALHGHRQCTPLLQIAGEASLQRSFSF